jgi:WD40 repeat protein
MSSDGNIVAVGAKDKTDLSGGEVGAVLLYSMETFPPTLIQTLVNDESGGEYGNSVGLSNNGNRLVVGARSENVGLFEQAGVVRVYERDAIGQWVLMGTPIVGTSDSVRAGWSVSISGDGSSVAIGAPKGGESEGGAVFTYRFDDEEGTWIPYGTVLEGDAGEAFGYATSLSNDGNLIAVGTPKAAREGLQNVGKASVFYLFGSEWVPLAGGSEVYGIDANDIDGTSVALSSQDGTILVIGGKGRDVDGVSNAGHCRVYKLGTEWELIHSIEGQTENERLGTSVAVSSDGNIVACGGETDGNTGVVKVWNQATSESSAVWPRDKQEGALFGYAVSLNEDGKMLAVGAPEWNSATAGEQAGAVEIYTELIS